MTFKMRAWQADPISLDDDSNHSAREGRGNRAPQPSRSLPRFAQGECGAEPVPLPGAPLRENQGHETDPLRGGSAPH